MSRVSIPRRDFCRVLPVASAALVLAEPLLGAESARLRTITANDFRPLLGSHFLIRGGSGAIHPAELVEVTEFALRGATCAPAPLRAPFLIVLEVQGRLGQDVYDVSHSRLEAMPLLLVPIGPVDGPSPFPVARYPATRLQAVFS